ADAFGLPAAAAAGDELREPVVADLDGPLVGEDITRLDIPMDDTPVVQIGHAGSDPVNPGERLFRRQALQMRCQGVCEASAGDVFHHDPRIALIVLTDVVQCQQIRVVRDARELGELPAAAGPIFAQQYVQGQGNGLDLKAYVVGDQVFAVSRPFPPRTAVEKRGQPYALSREVREICLRCGQLFGLELYGVDLIETPDGPSVIEVNCFPGYKGVPEAERLLGDYLLESAGRVN
ncbi:hypothetical protein LCGC14_1809770, partial [marine sediment metagenome]